MTPLITTKLHTPKPRQNIVSRPHLLERLSESLINKLTIISAPTGYGKTTLMADWRVGLGQDTPLAWLSLDEWDNDPARFLDYLIAALQNIQEDLGKDIQMILQGSQSPPNQAVLSILINELVAIPHDFILVLEDYHAIDVKEIHQMLAFLLDYMPPQMHLVIMTRADPPLPLGRLRALGQLSEIRVADLRFNLDEATAFLSEVMGLDLPADDIQILVRRTEGWIAGLQLAALSIMGSENPSKIIATYGGGYLYIVDYLVEEVLARQSDSLRMFLLQTSILERLSGPLCNAITGQSNGETMLEQLERANLFVTQLGNECCWYRYHHLFADVTRNLLKQRYPDQIPELHRRAAQWYGDNDFMPEAINHALKAGDWEYAGALMDDFSTITWRSGEITRILEWADELPKKVLFRFPKLSINYGWACVLTGRNEECEAACTQIEHRVQDNPELQVGWLTVQMFLARAWGQQNRAIALAQKALELPETGNVETRALLMLSLSIALWDLGKIKEAQNAAEEASRLAELDMNWHAWAIMQSFLGLAQAAFGNLHLAEEIYQRIVRGGPGMPQWAGGGFAQVCLAALFYEWNDLEKATEYTLACLEYSQITSHSEIQMNGYRQLAFIYQAQGNIHEAWETLKQAEQIIQKHHMPRLWGPEHVQIALAQNDLATALHWFKQVQGEYGAAIHYPAIPLESAKLVLAQGDKSGAIDLLNQSYQKASQDGVRYAQIEIRILQAIASTYEEQAMIYLCEALAWGEPEGFVRVFADQGEAIIPLLRKAAQRDIYPVYVTRLLSAIESPTEAGYAMEESRIDPLSERESEVLRLVAKGNSNQEIADELVIALGTVKRHIYNIFAKLDAKNRTDCVARAREFNLLE